MATRSPVPRSGSLGVSALAPRSKSGGVSTGTAQRKSVGFVIRNATLAQIMGDGAGGGRGEGGADLGVTPQTPMPIYRCHSELALQAYRRNEPVSLGSCFKYTALGLLFKIQNIGGHTERAFGIIFDKQKFSLTTWKVSTGKP